MLRRWCSLPCWNSTFHYTWRLQQSLAQSRVSEVRMQTDIGYNNILYNQNIWQSFYFGSLANRVTITKFNIHHLDYNHGFLSIEYSKLPI